MKEENFGIHWSMQIGIVFVTFVTFVFFYTLGRMVFG